VPVIIRDVDEDERLLVMAAENLQREDLSPLEEARAYQRLIDTLGCSQRDLAPKVGKTQSHISKRLALLALPKDVQKEVDSGGITIPDALELAKLADHPDRVKAVIKGPNWQSIPVRVQHELGELKLAATIRDLEEKFESQGLETIRVRSEWQLPKGVHRLKGGATYDMHALQITAAKHEKEQCHAIAITDHGLGFPVCTNRKNHKDVKTKQEADHGKRSTSAVAGGFRQPRETPTEKKRKQERERRLEFARGLVAKKPPKDAVTFMLRYLVWSEIQYLEGDTTLDRAAHWLGLCELEDNGYAPDTVDVDALLREFAAESETQLHRASLALAICALDDGGYNGVEALLEGSQVRGMSPLASAYLEFLRSQGYPEPVEAAKAA
jgi:hypothetical protein